MRRTGDGLRNNSRRLIGYAASQGGFSLIEVIITLVILSIAAVGVLSVFSTSMKSSANPLVLNQAIQLAQGEMDQVQGEKAAMGFSGIGAACATTMPPGLGFTCSRTICFVPAGNLNSSSACGSITSYKHITVKIQQAEIGSVSLDTIVSNY
jgi:prepilin-type N-terminal cleavage/methylation domain-containing protein